MLKDRLRTAAVLISVVVGLLYLDANRPLAGVAGLWLLPLVLFFALGTAWDFATLLQTGGHSVSRLGVLSATAVISLSACGPMLWPLVGTGDAKNGPEAQLGWTVIAAVLAVFLILTAEMGRFAARPAQPGEPQTVERISAAVLVSLYVGLPIALLVAMRSLGSGNWGLAAVLTTIAVTKSADTGAYFVGKTFGRHKLVPRLSPGKTWEGAIGGVITATIVAFGCLRWLFPALAEASPGPSLVAAGTGIDTPLFGAMILGPLLAVTGIIGDLAESLVKRSCGAKDSGEWLPGMGGVWDVTDSLIATVMPAYLCFSLGVGGSV